MNDNFILKWAGVAPHYEWLMEEENRMMLVDSVVKADEGI